VSKNALEERNIGILGNQTRLNNSFNSIKPH